MNELWENKIPRFDRITVPAYVVAGYSNTLHTTGTFRAWRRIASEHKWLRIHDSQEWPDFVLVQKLGAHGTPLQQFTTPNQGAIAQDLTERGASILRYKGVSPHEPKTQTEWILKGELAPLLRADGLNGQARACSTRSTVVSTSCLDTGSKPSTTRPWDMSRWRYFVEIGH